MESPALRLLQLLSFDAPRSGQEIADGLGCSRAAVWKQVEVLRSQGVDVVAVSGSGYVLTEPHELLDRAQILSGMPQPQRAQLKRVEILPCVDSTNAELQRRELSQQHAVCLLAERQTAGRGRHGRSWFSPLARNIYLSLGWRFELGLGELSALPLILALATSQALTRCGLVGHCIKWPNDLQLDGHKLGGCLVELQGDANGPCSTVLGVGLNVNMPVAKVPSGYIQQPWVDLDSYLPGISRNEVAAALISALVDYTIRFERSGFDEFMDEWAERDALADQEITLHLGERQISGIARGVTRRGGLRLETGGECRELHAGEVSLGQRG